MASAEKSALAAVRVLDLTDERAIYGAKLLADMGADTVRPEPTAGDPLRRRGPHQRAADDGSSSLWHAFFASSRCTTALDLATTEGQAQLQHLVDQPTSCWLALVPLASKQQGWMRLGRDGRNSW